MKYYENDEFPISLEGDRLECIGMCVQCPLYREYKEELDKAVDGYMHCVKILKEKKC